MKNAAFQGVFSARELRQLGLEPRDLVRCEVLRSAPAHIVCRVVLADRSYVVKAYRRGEHPLEVTAYSLFLSLGVPTLPLHAQSERALLLEDLRASPLWRAAAEEDLSCSAVGAAVARWYQCLHQAGRQYLRTARGPALFVKCWVDELDGPSLHLAGEKFALLHAPAWLETLHHLPALKKRYKSLPQTFNYNDFAAENLALSRGTAAPLRAVVFDYDCLRTGVSYSDYRNVLSALSGPARAAFIETYARTVDIREEILDSVLGLLYGLVIAAKRETRPGWAQPLVASVEDGTLARDLERAVGLLP